MQTLSVHGTAPYVGRGLGRTTAAQVVAQGAAVQLRVRPHLL